MEKLLTEVCAIQYGFPFDSSKFSENEGVPLIRIRDVVRGFSETYTTEEYKEEYLVHEGDLLIGMDGEFNIAKWGKVPSLLNQRVCRLIPLENIDKGYLFYFMPTALKRIEDKTPYVTVKHLSAKELNKVKVPLPPLEEQRKIAAVLDKVSDLIAKRRQQLEKLDELVKSRFIELFGDPERNPKGLPVLPWHEVFHTTTGKLDSNAMVEGGQYPFFTCAKENYWIDTYAFDCEALLLAGNNAAGVYDVKYYKGKFNAYQRTYVLRLINEQWSYKLFKRQLEDKLLYLQRRSKGTNTRYLTLGILNDLYFMVPPINQQEQFDVFAGRIDKSKLAIQKSLEKLETLKKALMQEYFG